LSASIQSSRHSGNNVDCPRSTPSTKRFIATSPENRVTILSCEAFSHSLGRQQKLSSAAENLEFCAAGLCFGLGLADVTEHRRGAIRTRTRLSDPKVGKLRYIQRCCIRHSGEAYRSPFDPSGDYL
jgi:hypothetical protein